METKKLERGLVHIYTGNGKGKTTSAIGQGVRSAGGGFKVLMAQFLKADDTGELYTIEKLGPDFQLIRFASMKKFYSKMNKEERNQVKEEVQQGLETIKTYLEEEKYNIIIMDEIMAVIYNNIIPLDEILSLVKNKPHDVEMILTGRNAPQELIEVADYVTEMKMIKHPFQKGIYARKGIES